MKTREGMRDMMKGDINIGAGKVAEEVVAVVEAGPKVVRGVKEIVEEIGAFPVIPLKVVNRHIMWTTIVECNGLKIQKNKFTKLYRIIDEDNRRQAWGTYKAMIKEIKELCRSNEKKYMSLEELEENFKVL